MNKNYIVHYINKTRKNTLRFIEDELKKNGITDLLASHITILLGLYDNSSGLTMKRITGLVNRDKSTVTQLINKLVDRGYVIRKKCIEDKRITYIILTDKAKEIEAVIRKIYESLIRRIYKDFKDEEIEGLLYLLRKLNNNFE